MNSATQPACLPQETPIGTMRVCRLKSDGVKMPEWRRRATHPLLICKHLWRWALHLSDLAALSSILSSNHKCCHPAHGHGIIPKLHAGQDTPKYQLSSMTIFSVSQSAQNPQRCPWSQTSYVAEILTISCTGLALPEWFVSAVHDPANAC